MLDWCSARRRATQSRARSWRHHARPRWRPWRCRGDSSLPGHPAAGHFTLQRAGQLHEVGDLAVVGSDEVLPLVDRRARRTWQRLQIKEFLRVRTLDGGTERTANLRSGPPRIAACGSDKASSNEKNEWEKETLAARSIGPDDSGWLRARPERVIRWWIRRLREHCWVMTRSRLVRRS
jgi:hypothetical protein